MCKVSNKIERDYPYVILFTYTGRKGSHRSEVKMSFYRSDSFPRILRGKILSRKANSLFYSSILLGDQ